jgi:GcrA cell cycle regulator
MKGWTEERVETLKTMWVGGFTASSIAGAIGGGITASAVRQKADGLGLDARGVPKGPRAFTSEQIETLKRLAGEGWNLSALAEELGATLGQVRGFARRNKIAITTSRSKKAERSRAIARQNKSQTPNPPRPHLIEDALIPEDNLPATDDPTGARGCRWPVGDPRTIGRPGDDFRFCQREKSGDGGPYCEGHKRRAYNCIPKLTDRPVRLRRNGTFANGGGR